MAPLGRQWFSLRRHGGADILAGVRGRRHPEYLPGPGTRGLRFGRRPSGADRVFAGQHDGDARRAPARRALRGGHRLFRYAGWPERLAAEIKSRPPVLLVHGEADEVVGFGAMAAAEQALKANSVAVTALARPGLGHGIDEAGIGAAMALLRETLAGDR